MIARQRLARRGFTLVELLVVAVVLAVLGAVVVPKLIGAGKPNRESSLKNDLRIIRRAIQTFYNSTGYYPTQLIDLAATKAPANGLDSSGKIRAIIPSDWNGPYMLTVPNDPVSGTTFNYGNGLKPGEVRSSATGNATDSTAYSSW